MGMRVESVLGVVPRHELQGEERRGTAVAISRIRMSFKERPRFQNTTIQSILFSK
jgi:hypothetical protein